MAKSNEEKMLELLAFGKVTDTVKLLTEMQKEKPDPAIFDKLELRNIHTIRCTSTGGFEVEFYDRFKAMLTLRGLRAGDGEPSLYSALQSAAAGLSQEKEEQEYLSRHE